MSPLPRCTRRQRLLLAGIVLFAAGLRVAWVAYAARTPVGLIDPAFYSGHAQDLALGRGYRYLGFAQTAYYPVGYPAALAAVLWWLRTVHISYALPTVVGVLNLVLGVATVLLVFDLARRVARDVRVGLLAAAFVAFWPNLVFHTAVALSETLFNLLVVAVLAVLVVPDWRLFGPRWPSLALAGGLVGLSALVRPISFLLVPALLVVWARRDVLGWRSAVRRMAVVAAAAVAVVLPWTIRNVVVLDAPVLISTNLGDNLCIGRYPGASGGFATPDYCFHDQPPMTEPGADVHRNSALTRRAIRYAAGHPLQELSLIPRRAYYTVKNDHDGIDAAESYGRDPFIPASRRSALAHVADGWFYAMAALTIAGLVRLYRDRDPRVSMLRWSMLALAVPPLLFFGDPRFKMPAVPCMAVFAAIAVVRTVDRRRETQNS